MYTTIGAQDLWKGALDVATDFINTLNKLPKLFGTIPVGAIAMVGEFVNLIKNVAIKALSGIGKIWE